MRIKGFSIQETQNFSCYVHIIWASPNDSFPLSSARELQGSHTVRPLSGSVPSCFIFSDFFILFISFFTDIEYNSLGQLP